MISVVFSNGAFVKKDFTSKDTIWKLFGNFLCFAILIIESFLLFMEYFDSRYEDSIFANYFARWYIDVPRLGIIGLIGRLFILSFGGILCVFTML